MEVFVIRHNAKKFRKMHEKTTSLKDAFSICQDHYLISASLGYPKQISICPEMSNFISLIEIVTQFIRIILENLVCFL